jgi:hypothetical protein
MSCFFSKPTKQLREFGLLTAIYLSSQIIQAIRFSTSCYTPVSLFFFFQFSDWYDQFHLLPINSTLPSQEYSNYRRAAIKEKPAMIVSNAMNDQISSAGTFCARDFIHTNVSWQHIPQKLNPHIHSRTFQTHFVACLHVSKSCIG